jgi:hypothetical protein
MWTITEVKKILLSFPEYVDAKIKLLDSDLTMKEYKDLRAFISDFETKYFDFIERLDN